MVLGENRHYNDTNEGFFDNVKYIDRFYCNLRRVSAHLIPCEGQCSEVQGQLSCKCLVVLALVNVKQKK